MKIIQMHNSTISQMMGYILVTEHGHVIAVDGGTEGDLPAFRQLVLEHGGHIDLWFLTHPHHDHHDVFALLSEHPEPEITVGGVYYSPAPADFVVTDTDRSRDEIDRLNAAVKISPYPVHPLRAHDTFQVDNVTVDVLRVVNPAVKEDSVNNLSIVLKLTEHASPHTDFRMIFLGDLGRSGGEELLSTYADNLQILKADAVQMAHHGQNGVELPVYQAIAPAYTFWPAPDWLWTNTPGGSAPGSGPWKTLEVRAWMEQLGSKPITSLREHTVFDTKSAL